MSIDVLPLFEPLHIRGRMLRNRVVLPPMVAQRDLKGPEGIDWYARRAQGVGLVIVESTDIGRFRDELTVEALRPLVDAVHAAGALLAIQLFPTVRVVPTSPAELSEEDIAAILDTYRLAAETCLRAGFDGVEPHGAHGYLLNQFFSPEQNLRTDGYGGDLTARMRMALEVVDAIKSTVGDELLLLYRHTPVGRGYGIEESLALGRELVAAGVDVLDLSPSSIEAPGDRAAPFKALGVPVIAVNLLDEVERALEVLNERRADLVAVGRGMIADPDWPLKVAEGRFDEIVRCIRCDGCHADLRRGDAVGCTQW